MVLHVQWNMFNPTNQGTREIRQILQGVRIFWFQFWSMNKFNKRNCVYLLNVGWLK